MLLRTLLLFLFGWFLFRALGGLFRLGQGTAPSSSRPGEPPRPKRRLDPDKSVSAAWKEVDEEGRER